MSNAEYAAERIRLNTQRTVGPRALKALRDPVDEELRAEAANALYVREFLKYGIIIMLAACIVLALAHWLGVL